jgi:ankyrin repeat protein
MDSYDVSQLITNAISNNDIKFVEDAFVQYNDKINKETYEWPILVRVADKGSLDMLNVILKHKQNIDIAIPKRNDFVGFRAMHFAILRLDIEIVKSLVDAGADINMPISNVSAYNANIAGVTPLQFQMRLKADQIFALKLLELGASPFIFKENLETPIDYAREYKWADFLKVIANHNPKVSKIQITINSHFFHHCSHFEIAAIYATEDTKKPFKKIVLEKLTDIDPETPIKIPRSIPILYANDGFAQSIQIEVSENGVCRCSTWLHQSVIDKAKPKDQITNEVVGGSSQMDFTFTFI